MSKITAAYVHVRKSKEDFGVIGIAVTKSKDTNWYLFKNDDQKPEKHSFVAEKWRSQCKTPRQYRNVLVQGDPLKLYLNEDETAFAFCGALLDRDEQNSIKEQGLFLF